MTPTQLTIAVFALAIAVTAISWLALLSHRTLGQWCKRNSEGIIKLYGHVDKIKQDQIEGMERELGR